MSRSLCQLLFSVLLIGLLSESASAADWMWRRSYHSHAPSPAAYSGPQPHAHPAEAAPGYGYAGVPAPRSRSAYREPITQAGPGYAIRAGFRWNTIRLRSGNSTDTTVIYEEWAGEAP